MFELWRIGVGLGCASHYGGFILLVVMVVTVVLFIMIPEVAGAAILFGLGFHFLSFLTVFLIRAVFL